MITLDTTTAVLLGIGLVAWAGISVYLARKHRWFYVPCAMEAFPFNARQFFVIGASLFFAIAIFLVSGKLAHSFVLGFQQTPIAEGFVYAPSEWLGLEHIISLLLMAAGLALLVSLLPADLLPIVTGKSKGWKNFCAGLFIGIMAFPVIMLVTNIVGWIVSKHYPRVDQEALTFLLKLDRSSVIFYIMIASIICIVPYVEEIIFRGFIQGFLGGLVHPILAVIITAGLFAMFHFAPSQQYGNIEIMSGLGVYSVLASFVRIRENAILSAIGMHAAFNAISLSTFFILK